MMEKKDISVESEEGENLDGKPNNRFSIDELRMFWRQFAFQLKEEGNESLYSGLIKVDPNMPQDYQIIHVFDNQVLLDMMNLRKQDLLGFLREKLKNWSLDIEFVLNQVQEIEQMDISERDKFKRMTDKNASLITMQKVFGLDVEM